MYSSVQPQRVVVLDRTLLQAALLSDVWSMSPLRGPRRPCADGTVLAEPRVHLCLRCDGGGAAPPRLEYDFTLQRACNDGSLVRVRVLPEIIHQQRRVDSESLSFGIDASAGRVGRMFTHNIQHSARCNWDRGMTS